MKILEFHKRIIKIMKILEFQYRELWKSRKSANYIKILWKSKKQKWEKHENPDNPRISLKNNKNN